jgi:threonine 3-dehydrogenase
VSDYRLALAGATGVTRTVDARSTSLTDVQRDLGMEEGFDVGLEMSGHRQPLQDMIANMAHGGRIAMLGLQASAVAIDWSEVVMKMLTIRGIYGREMFESWYTMSALLQTGLDITPVITHRFPYRDFEEAFRVARTGQCGKVVLDWTAD